MKPSLIALRSLALTACVILATGTMLVGCGRRDNETVAAALPSPAPAATVTPAPVVFPTDGSPYQLTFPELYSSATITGPVLSPLAAALNDQPVTMVGYMAPPLKPNLDFFVLTKTPMVNCPFCSTATDWPYDIVFVRMASGTIVPNVPTQGIRVTGRFSVGVDTDKPTGFVSMVRIYAENVEVLN